MKRLAFLLFIFFLAPGPGVPSLWGANLSPAARITLLTASPGEELYSVFGHSALRVSDPVAGIDEVYNYGTFDFDTPFFYYRFTRGQLYYKLSVTSMQRFMLEYQYEGRAVYEQVLNLTQREKQRIYDFLQINRLPENQYYWYDFFYDNCATRIRDLVDDHLDLDWGEDPFPMEQRSFRDMLKPYLVNMPWNGFGIDIALGLPSDQLADPWHYMFLPDEMFIAFAQARHSDGRPLVDGYQVVLEETLVVSPPGPFSPGLVWWLLLIVGLASFARRQWSLWFDRIYFSLLGVIGLIVFFLWFLSEHHATNNNMNILWALPTHLYFIFKLRNGYAEGLARYYFRIVFIINAALLVLWPWLPQDFHAAFFPMILLAAIKAFSYGFDAPALRKKLARRVGIEP
jgi:hypothetical protein